jgi:hypothetical protein
VTTITLTEIIAHLVTVVEDLTPTADPSARPFRRSSAPNREPLRRWAPDVGGNGLLRLFDLRRSSARSDGGINHFAARLATVELTMTLAYPATPSLYGLDEYEELEALIEKDAHQIHDALSGAGALAGAGHIAVYPTIEALDQALERIWYQELSLDVLHYIARAA